MPDDKITDSSRRPQEVEKSALEVNTVDATEVQKRQADQEINKDPIVAQAPVEEPKKAGRRTKAQIEADEKAEAAAEAAANGGIAKDTATSSAHAATLQTLSSDRRAAQLKSISG